MSAIFYNDYAIGRALGAFDDSFGYSSDAETVQRGLKSMQKADDHLESGDFAAAAVEFYKVHAPSVDDEELKAVTDYLAKLNHPDTHPDGQKQIACIVFGFGDCDGNYDASQYIYQGQA